MGRGAREKEPLMFYSLVGEMSQEFLIASRWKCHEYYKLKRTLIIKELTRTNRRNLADTEDNLYCVSLSFTPLLFLVQLLCYSLQVIQAIWCYSVWSTGNIVTTH